MSKYVGIIVGAALIATGIGGVLGIPMFTIAFTNFAASYATALITAGASLALSGVGTLLTTKTQLGGFGSASRNPVAPWGVNYGREKIGGTIVFLNEFGDDNKYLDLVIVLACHPCESVDALLFDNQRVPIDGSGDSYTPTQVNVSIASITRSGGIVTLVTSTAFADVEDGDLLQIESITTDPTLNGKYAVEKLSTTSFRYLCGGLDVSITGQGVVQTAWPNYKSKVHMEVLLGNQSATFPGMLYGTPYDGDPDDLIHNSNNPWTAAHVLKGRTAVFLRLHYNDTIFANGLPSISFRVHGKNDIYDPRTATAPLQRPTIYLNGWGHNAHEGAYEMGVDQGHGWGLNDDTTYSYSTADQAIDGDTNSYASSSYRHTHKYAGCIWRFAALGATPSALWLNVLSEVPSTGSGMKRSAGIWYSLDGGATWIQVYDEANRAKQWDNIHLSTGQDASLVQVMAFLDSHDDMAQRVYDVQLATGPAGSGYGYTENAALCIADYLAQPVWGFRAKYGTEIPAPELISAANICDEVVPLADGGTEPRYLCNGTFPLSLKRGEILQNLLTSCGGRLTYSEGQFVIHPAAWPGTSLLIGSKPVASATVHVISSNTAASDGTIGSANITVGSAYGGSEWTPVVFDGTAYAARTDSLVLSSTVAASLGSLEIWCRNFETIFTILDDPCTVAIFDCWVDAVYADGSTGVWRPRQTRQEVVDSREGSIEHQGAAIDGDTTTAATINRVRFNPLIDSNMLSLVLYGFAPAEASGPPDTSPAGMTASGQALSQAAGPFQWKSKVSARDLYNGVKGTYISPLNNWESSDIPPYAQDPDHGYPADANLAEDNGERRWFDMQLPFTISSACAQRLAKIELLRRRQQGIGTFAFNLWMYQATALDIVDFTLPLLGWNHKLLEVVSHRFTLNRQQDEGGGDVTVLGTEVDLQETDPSIYEWDPSEEVTAQGVQQAGLPDMKTVQSPTGVSAISGTATAVTGADGVSRSRILTTWVPPADGYVLNGGHMEVRYQNAAGGGGGTGSSDTLTRIANDMGSNEGHPHGVPSDWDFYSGSFVTDGNDPGTNTAMEFWGALYIDGGGNPATNTLVNIRNCQIWWRRASTGAWTLGILTSAPEVGSYAEDFSTDYGTLTPRTESDGTISFKPAGPGKMAHFYAPFPRVLIDPADMGGIVSVLEARLIVDNSGLADDRSSAKFLLEAGGDYYPDTTGPGIENNPGIGGGKFKYVTADWNSFAFTTLSLAELSAEPTPAIDLSGSGGGSGTGGSGGSTWIGLPSVNPSVTQVYIDGVTDGATYNVQVRSVNAAGAASDWVAAAPVTVSGTASVIPPSTISGDGADPGDVLVWDGSEWTSTPPSGGNAVSETPAGTMNGVNTAFALSFAPVSGSLTLWLNGVEQVPAVDYTISGTTITYLVAPKASDLMVAEYTH